MVNIVIEIVLGCDLGDLTSSLGFLSLVLCSLYRKSLSFLPLFIFISPHKSYFVTSVTMVEQTQNNRVLELKEV